MNSWLKFFVSLPPPSLSLCSILLRVVFLRDLNDGTPQDSVYVFRRVMPERVIDFDLLKR